MASYYVNKNAQDNGDYEVHHHGCAYLPDINNREYLGDYSSCAPAVSKAKQTYSRANGCYYCSPSCHTS